MRHLTTRSRSRERSTPSRADRNANGSRRRLLCLLRVHATLLVGSADPRFHVPATGLKLAHFASIAALRAVAKPPRRARFPRWNRHSVGGLMPPILSQSARQEGGRWDEKIRWLNRW